MLQKIFRMGSTHLAIASLFFALGTFFAGAEVVAYWAFGIAFVLSAFSIGWTVWHSGGFHPTPAHHPVGAYAPPMVVPAIARPARSWTSWILDLGATMWLAIGGLMFSLWQFATGEFLWGTIFLAFACIGLLFHYEKEGEVWVWTKSTAWPFAKKHWKWLWLAISVVGVIWTVMSNGYLNYLYGWILSTILAAFTAFGLWEGVMVVVGKTLTGQYSYGLTMLCWSMLLAGFAGLLNSIVPHGNQFMLYMGAFGLSLVLFWGGVWRVVYEIKNKSR